MQMQMNSRSGGVLHSAKLEIGECNRRHTWGGESLLPVALGEVGNWRVQQSAWRRGSEAVVLLHSVKLESGECNNSRRGKKIMENLINMPETEFVRYADKKIAVRDLKGLCLPCHLDWKNHYWETKMTDHLEWREHLQFPIFIWLGLVPDFVKEASETEWFKKFWDHREIDGFEVWFYHCEVPPSKWRYYDSFEAPWMTMEVARMVPDNFPINRENRVKWAKVAREAKSKLRDKRPARKGKLDEV